MDYGFWADVISVVHFAYFGFVVLGQVFILLGIVRRWQWVRNLWFRAAHLLAIALVAIEAVIDMKCPLTEWERALREKAGETISDASFMARLANEIMFHEFDEWVFRIAHIAFAVIVVATFVIAPPRWRRKSEG
jgi:hypothetical protein